MSKVIRLETREGGTPSIERSSSTEFARILRSGAGCCRGAGAVVEGAGVRWDSLSVPRMDLVPGDRAGPDPNPLPGCHQLMAGNQKVIALADTIYSREDA